MRAYTGTCRWFAWIAGLGLAAVMTLGCQKQGSNSKAKHHVDPIFVGGDLVPESPLDSLEAVKEFLRIANLPEPKCGDAPCAKIPLTFVTDPTPVKAHLGEIRILFLESMTTPTEALTSHREQTLGFYRWDKEKGDFVPRDIQFKMTSKAHQLFYTRTEGGLEQFPAKALRGMKDLYELPVSIAELPSPDLGLLHGEIGYSFLKALNPQAKFLFAPISSEVDGNLEDPDHLDLVSQKLNRLRESYNKLIRTHHLNRLSAAFSPYKWAQFVGMDLVPRGVKPTSELKAKYLRYAELAKQFWENLAADNPGLLIFVVIGNDVRDLEYKDRAWLRDFYCFNHPRVFRVGYVNERHNRIPLDGVPLTNQNTPGLIDPGRECIDIAISSGFEPDDRAINAADPLSLEYPAKRGKRASYLILNGHLRIPLHFVSTSWATPMALSFVNRLVENFRRQNSREINLDSLKSMVRGRAFDPFYHGQFLSNPYWDGETEEPSNCEARRVRALYTGCVEPSHYTSLRNNGEIPVCQPDSKGETRLVRIESCR